MDEANSKFAAPDAILNFYKKNKHVLVMINGNETTTATWRVVTEGFKNSVSRAGKGLSNLEDWLKSVTK